METLWSNGSAEAKSTSSSCSYSFSQWWGSKQWKHSTTDHRRRFQKDSGNNQQLWKEEQETQACFHIKDYALTVGKSKKEMGLEHCGRKYNLVIQEKTKHHREAHAMNFGNAEVLWSVPALWEKTMNRGVTGLLLCICMNNKVEQQFISASSEKYVIKLKYPTWQRSGVPGHMRKSRDQHWSWGVKRP